MRSGVNLTFRIAAILLVGFILLQLTVVVLVTLPHYGSDDRPYNLPLPGEVAAMVAAIEVAIPSQRPALVGALDGSLYTVRIAAAQPVVANVPPDSALISLAQSYRTILPGRAVAIASRPPLFGGLVRTGPSLTRWLLPVTLAVQLNSGEVLIIDSGPSRLVRGFLRQRALMGALGGAFVLFVLGLTLRQMTRPIVHLSRGIRQFAGALDAPDLPVEGSREMRELASTYNEMKARIAGLVAERTRVLAAVAHDLRTYLTRLRLRAEFIDVPEQRVRAIADLDEMAQLLDDTLMFAGPRRVAPRAAVDLAGELAARVAVRREIGQTIEAEIGASPALILARPLALRRIFDNLLDNAVHYGATVVEVALVRADADWAVTIGDRGPGVAPDLLERLGQPFERGEPSRNRTSGGAGLGLAIVRALVDEESGRLTLANRIGGGFIATVRFKAEQQELLKQNEATEWTRASK